MFSTRPLTQSGLGLVILAGLATSALPAQTSLDIDGLTRASNGSGGWTYSTWKPMLGISGAAQTNPADGYLGDPLTDQQTGQSNSDFATTISPLTNSGFLVQFGTINGVQHLGFRIILNEYATTGNLVNIRVGLDGNGDGDVDIYMGPSQQNNQTGLVFQGTGNGLNISPNTSTLTNAFYPASAGVGSALPFTADNFSNIELTTANVATYYPGWTIADEDPTDNKAAQSDAMITFAIPLAHINAALAELGAGFTIGPATYMRWLAFTATQNNTINQDVYGLAKITQSSGLGDSTYSSFLPLMNSFGQPVPEPSTYGAALGLGLAALLGLRRHPRPAAPPPPAPPAAARPC